MRAKAKVKIPFQVERSIGHEIPPALEESTDVRFGSEAFRQHSRVERMKFQFELGHDSKVSTAPAQGPEQICIFLCIGMHEGAVNRDESKGFDIVARQAESTGEP